MDSEQQRCFERDFRLRLRLRLRSIASQHRRVGPRIFLSDSDRQTIPRLRVKSHQPLGDLAPWRLGANPFPSLSPRQNAESKDHGPPVKPGKQGWETMAPHLRPELIVASWLCARQYCGHGRCSRQSQTCRTSAPNRKGCVGLEPTSRQN